MSFLPKDYKDPTTGSNYMSFEEGDNKFRILSSPVMGWEYWVEDGDKRKPVRVRDFKDVPAEHRAPSDSRAKAKYFWAMLVWNYEAERAQLLQISQATIRSAITNLDGDPDWGDAREYDLLVKKSGKGMDTEYAVNPKPKAKFVKKDKEIPYVNLEGLFTGEDPFNSIELNTAELDAALGDATPLADLDSSDSKSG